MSNSIFLTKNKTYLFILIVCLLLIVSCASKLKGTNNTFQDKLEQSIDTAISNNKIIFLNYSISKNNTGNKKIEFISKIIAEGKIKKNSNKFISEESAGDLQCIQMGASNTLIKSVILKNPLSRIIEYVNESNVLEKRKIEAKEIPFSIRIQLEPKTKFIVINEVIIPEKKASRLITTEIY